MIQKSKEANPNYLAKIVEIKNLRKHPNADRLQIATIDFQDVICGMEVKEGDVMVFFPLECQINPDFLKFTNSFSSQLLNEDTTVKGYFDKSGRVKAVKLRGEKSMGCLFPLCELEVFAGEAFESLKDVIGQEFDLFDGIQICKKYMVPVKNSGQSNRLGKKPRISRLVEGQVHLHVDTENLRKEAYKIHPEDEISISYKVHGTSFWVSNVLVKKKLSILDRLFRFLGIKVQETHYDIVYGSRKVVKNEYETQNKNDYYGYDIWGTIADEIKEVIPKGFTIYGEAIGYTNEGSYIQKDYDYGCSQGQKKIQVYRITFTNEDGLVVNLSASQIKEFCDRKGLDTVHYFYIGKAKDLYELDTDTHWNENFIKNLERDFNDKECFMCNNVVPEEGIVLRKEKMLEFESYKLKSFSFLERESKLLDRGEADLESAN